MSIFLRINNLAKKYKCVKLQSEIPCWNPPKFFNKAFSE